MTNPLAFVIEDDEDLSMIFAAALTEAEYQVDIIQDGQLALNRLATETPTVIVLDLHLPHVDGRRILAFIRSLPQLKNSRVMLATADPLMADSLRTEVDLVLLKPISYDQLRDLSARLRPKV
jgi:CheY-like chemotaxis protein